MYLHLYKLLTKNCKRRGQQYMQLNNNISLSSYMKACKDTINKCLTALCPEYSLF